MAPAGWWLRGVGDHLPARVSLPLLGCEAAQGPWAVPHSAGAGCAGSTAWMAAFPQALQGSAPAVAPREFSLAVGAQ